MKNAVLLSILVLFLSQTADAQNRRAPKRHADFNAGIGLLPTYLKDAGKMVSPPLSLSADFMLAENFSLGAFAGFSITETGLRAMRDGGTAKWRNHSSIFGLRMAAQSRPIGAWNIYGGMTAAYALSNIDVVEGQLEKVKQEKGLKESSGKMIFGGFIGGRHKLTPHLGLFGELGFGISLATVGLSVRI